MQIRALAVPGAWEATPRQFADDRGSFLEWFTESSFSEVTGHSLNLAQANISMSHRGVLRGIHFAQVPPGQAKYVTCVRGSVLDVVVDLRVGSPTFGASDSVLLDAVDRRAVYIAEGIGHGFLALEDHSTVVYLCSTPYAPQREHEIHPLDPALGIEWPSELEPLLSPKDAAAPTLAEALERGVLPTWAATQAYVAKLEG
jgi:dTDP-4-dehydrorhamnose 3,5-epimerase